MIDNYELRLGNWLLNKEGHPFNVGHIQNNFYGVEVNSMYPDNFSPIPLTPEILEKCGFVKHQDSDWHENLYSLGDLIFSLSGYFIFTSAYGYYSEIGSVRYLHQLQNLYYALTGTELNVQL